MRARSRLSIVVHHLYLCVLVRRSVEPLSRCLSSGKVEERTGYGTAHQSSPIERRWPRAFMSDLFCWRTGRAERRVAESVRFVGIVEGSLLIQMHVVVFSSTITEYSRKKKVEHRQEGVCRRDRGEA